MELSTAIDQACAAAMKSKDGARLDAFRMLKAAIKNKAIDLRKPGLTDEEIIVIIRGEIKKRREAIELYTQGGRLELASKEQGELDLLQTFLPAELSDEEIRAKVKEIVAGLAEEERKNFGKVMGAVMKAFQGKVDGTRVTVFVKEMLETLAA